MIIKICAFLSKRWLRKVTSPVKKELIHTRRFILKAEAQWSVESMSGAGDFKGVKKLEKYFSVHIFQPPDTIGPGPAWWYVKYQFNNNWTYSEIRHGKYPYEWE